MINNFASINNANNYFSIMISVIEGYC